jgi:hypothetical protein
MADRYWVGNSGHWNDTNHWSQTSGGVSGESIPTQKDAVVFDADSFSDEGLIIFPTEATPNNVLVLNFEGEDGATIWAEGAQDLTPTINFGAELDTDYHYSGSSSLKMRGKVSEELDGYSSVLYDIGVLPSDFSVVTHFCFLAGGFTTTDNSATPLWLYGLNMQSNYPIIGVSIYYHYTNTFRLRIYAIDKDNDASAWYDEVCTLTAGVFHKIEVIVTGSNLVVKIDDFEYVNETSEKSNPYAGLYQVGFQNYSNANGKLWIDSTSISSASAHSNSWYLNDLLHKITMVGVDNTPVAGTWTDGTATEVTVISTAPSNRATTFTPTLEEDTDYIMEYDFHLESGDLPYFDGFSAFTLNEGRNIIGPFTSSACPYIYLYNVGTFTNYTISNFTIKKSIPWTLTIPSGTVNAYNLVLHDSQAIGGAIFTALLENGNIDGGGNSGWSFYPTRYWVGGSGTWDDSDTTHWSLTSGGAGGASVPDSETDVWFDTHSFSSADQTVTIEDNVFVNNFNTTGVTRDIYIIISNFCSLTISGTVFFVKHNVTMMSDEYSCVQICGPLCVITTEPTIAPANCTTNLTIAVIDLIEGMSHVVQLASDIVAKQFTFHGATLITNDYDITVSDYFAIYEASGSGVLGASTIRARMMEFTTSGISFGTSELIITVNYEQSSCLVTNQNDFYNVTVQGSGYQTLNDIFTLQCLVTVLDGCPTFNSLLFKDPPYKVYVEPLTMYQCNTFDVIGTAGNLIEFYTDTGNIWLLYSLEGADLEYCSLNGSYAWGVAIYNALESNGCVDNGYNFNWNFGNRRYWVGGSGDWNDTAHWSLTSGGAGGASVPDRTSNVVLDENSGSNINVSITGGAEVKTVRIYMGRLLNFVPDYFDVYESFVYCTPQSSSPVFYCVGGHVRMFMSFQMGNPTMGFHLYCDGASSSFLIAPMNYLLEAFAVVGSDVEHTTTIRGIISNITGEQWTLYGETGEINLSYVTLKDALAEGGAAFNALLSNGCIDGGNNTGWNFGASLDGGGLFFLNG